MDQLYDRDPEQCVSSERLHGEYFPEHRHTEVAGATNSVVVFTKPCIELKLFYESAQILQHIRCSQFNQKPTSQICLKRNQM